MNKKGEEHKKAIASSTVNLAYPDDLTGIWCKVQGSSRNCIRRESEHHVVGVRYLRPGMQLRAMWQPSPRSLHSTGSSHPMRWCGITRRSALRSTFP